MTISERERKEAEMDALRRVHDHIFAKHEELIAEHRASKWGWMSVNNYRIIGASRAMKQLGKDVLAMHTELYEELSELGADE